MKNFVMPLHRAASPAGMTAAAAVVALALGCWLGTALGGALVLLFAVPAATTAYHVAEALEERLRARRAGGRSSVLTGAEVPASAE